MNLGVNMELMKGSSVDSLSKFLGLNPSLAGAQEWTFDWWMELIEVIAELCEMITELTW